jgi:hypothetical protein
VLSRVLYHHCHCQWLPLTSLLFRPTVEVNTCEKKKREEKSKEREKHSCVSVPVLRLLTREVPHVLVFFFSSSIFYTCRFCFPSHYLATLCHWR